MPALTPGIPAWTGVPTSAKPWTGYPELNSDAFRVFGKNGAGGCAAFWLVRPDRTLVEQSVVVLGSEGETGVAARGLGGFLWLLAGGFGPWEAATPTTSPTGLHGPTRHARPSRSASLRIESSRPGAVIEWAAQEFPDFDDAITELCR